MCLCDECQLTPLFVDSAQAVWALFCFDGLAPIVTSNNSHGQTDRSEESKRFHRQWLNGHDTVSISGPGVLSFQPN